MEVYEMANISVDHSQLEKTASAIDSYVSKHRAKMKTIDQSITFLKASWQGADYEQLKKEWQEMNTSDSTSEKMLKSLENYADFLRFAANKYKSAQTNAVNRANQLPRY